MCVCTYIYAMSHIHHNTWCSNWGCFNIKRRRAYSHIIMLVLSSSNYHFPPLFPAIFSFYILFYKYVFLNFISHICFSFFIAFFQPFLFFFFFFSSLCKSFLGIDFHILIQMPLPFLSLYFLVAVDSSVINQWIPGF